MSQYSENKFYDSDNHSWGLLFKYVKDGASVLDVGCSSGTLGQTLIERKRCVVDGIEPFHDDALEASLKLRNVYEVNVETGDLSALKHKYDIIIFADVIEHLVEPVSTLRKMRRYLKKDGVILYSIPNMAHISIRLSLLEGNFDHTETGLIDKTHLHFYTSQQIKRTFEDAGYTITDQKYTYIVYPKHYINERLEVLGLAPTSDKVIKQLNDDVESQAFQYVGVAKQSNKNTAHKPITILPHQTDAKQVNDHIDMMENKISDLTKDLNKLKTELNEQQVKNAALHSQNTRLGYRVVKKAYKVTDARHKKKD